MTPVRRGRTVYRAKPTLRKLRETGPNPYTLRELAETVGVDPSYLSKVELRARNVSPALSLSIARALDAPRNELFTAVLNPANPTRKDPS